MQPARDATESPTSWPDLRAASALSALSFASLVAACLLLASAAGWDVQALMQSELRGYSWDRSVVDAVAVLLLACLVSSVAICAQPAVAVAAGSSAAIAALVKLICLGEARWRGDSLAAAVVVLVGCVFCVLAGGEAIAAGRRLSRRLVVVRGEASRSDKLLDAEAGGRPPREVTFGRLLGLARPELPLLATATVALFFSSAAQMAMPGLVGHMVGGVIGGAAGEASDAKRRALNGAVLQLACVFVAGGFFSFVRGYLFTLAGERVVARLRRRLFSALVRQEVSFFDANTTGELMNRLASDTTVIQSAVTVNVSMGLRFGAQVVLGLVLIFAESWKLSLLMLAVVPAIVAVGVVYGRFMKRFSKQYQAALARAADVAQECFSGIRTVRSFANEPREADRYDGAVDESFGLGRKKALAYGAFGSLIGTTGQFAVVGVLWYGGALVIAGEMSLGTLTSFLLYTVVIAGCLGGLSDLFGSLMNALGASSRVFALLDASPARPLAEGLRPERVRGQLHLSDVSFSYPARPEALVLDGVSLRIEPGSVVALCGPSGSGKSTVIGLLERWYEPTRGSITLDGVPLASIDGSWWRKQVALVAQEPVLFACSIRDNIAYGKPAAADDEVRAAASTANAEAFVDAFPRGFDTMVGERGVQLSGGQKQRIAIARALLVDPKVLLLDEATSALDSESEFVVQEAIDRLMASRTTVVIAHRLSTIRDASLICVVSKGRIVERGTHQELMAATGLYKQLTARQALGPGGGRRIGSGP